MGAASRWAIVPLAALKMLLIVFIPPGSDFINWPNGAGVALAFILRGKLPPVTATGVYGSIYVILAPFYWLWAALPIQHPPLDSLVFSPYSVAALSLSIIMKTPIFVCDFATTILISKFVTSISLSERRSGIAAFSWYANPFAIYWMYVYGGMDVIPTAIFLLGLYYGGKDNWVRCGFCALIAGLLRIFAFVAFPFFIPFAKSNANRAKLISGFATPLVVFLGIIYATGTGSLSAIASVPMKENWLLYFLGPSLPTGDFLILTPLLLVVQLYILIRYWKKTSSIVYVATVSLLALLIGGSSSYTGGQQHFIWVSPLLSICLGLSPGEAWIFLLTFLGAYLAPAEYPFSALPHRHLLDPILVAFFYAMKTIYLARINLNNLDPRIGSWVKIMRTPPIAQRLIT
jgi:hypothetical protein